MKISSFARAFLFATGLILTNVGFAQSPFSQGCNGINNPDFDAQYADTNPGPWAFNADETIQMTAGPPDSTGQTNVRLYVDSDLVDSVTFPGTVSYTFPTNMTVDVEWITSNNATWVVECSVESTPPPSSSNTSIPTLNRIGIAVLVALLAGFAFFTTRKTFV